MRRSIIRVAAAALSAFLVAGAAEAQSGGGSAAVTVIEEALKCAVPHTTREDERGRTIRTFSEKFYVGNETFFRLIGTSEMRVHDPSDNSVTEVRNTYDYSAAVNKIVGIGQDGRAVELQCRAGDPCIKQTRAYWRNGRWQGEPDQYAVTARLTLCSAEVAAYFKEALTALMAPAEAAEPVPPGYRRCVVSDPTGTPLNVRDAPSGSLTGRTLDDGTTILVSHVDKDGRGRDWAAVLDDDLRRLGYVFAAYLTCRAPR